MTITQMPIQHMHLPLAVLYITTTMKKPLGRLWLAFWGWPVRQVAKGDVIDRAHPGSNPFKPANGREPH